MKILRVEFKNYIFRSVGSHNPFIMCGFYVGLRYEFDTFNDMYYAFCHPEHNPEPTSEQEPALRNFKENFPVEFKNYIFGFHKKNLMNNWFGHVNPKFLKEIYNNGNFFVLTYDVDPTKVIKGNKQCMFLNDKTATVLKSQSFEEYFKENLI